MKTLVQIELVEMRVSAQHFTSNFVRKTLPGYSHLLQIFAIYPSERRNDVNCDDNAYLFVSKL